MKKTILLIFILALIVPASIQNDRKSFNRERTYDVLHYVIRLDFDRKAKSVKGDSTIELTPLEKPLSQVVLDAKDLKYEFVGMEGSSEPLQYTVNGKNLTIKLPRAFEPGEKIAFRIRYTAKPKKGIYFRDALVEKGKVVRGAQVWTQGESEETHHWLPSFDFPDDKATTEQMLAVENGETAIGNGEFLGKKDLEDGRAVYHYRMDVPHSLYLTSFVIGTYVKVSDKYKDIPLGYYVYPGQESIVPLAYGKTKDMFRVFEELTGLDYPFNKYDQTMVAKFPWGGMENITATTMADTEIMLARVKFGQGLVEDLVAHELAHSWFGNLVTCRNWAELWLNEGFATFMEGVFREKAYGREIYDLKIASDAEEYLAYASAPGTKEHPLFNTSADASDDNSMFTTVTYQKGGSVIHMLREEIGEEAFWKGVHLYLTRNRLKNVETPDLIAAMEEASERDLRWFFEQWVYKKGFPKLRVTSSYDRAAGKLKVSMAQTQKISEGIPVSFRLPVALRFITASGPVDREIVIEKRSQEFEFDFSSRPSDIIVDPRNSIPVKTVDVVKES
ncbi:MAG TPA: M1 family aminopeptidase [Aridibacter sp.]|nr:M1 family aminopeptidase [Aridibacter sp.]